MSTLAFALIAESVEENRDLCFRGIHDHAEMDIRSGFVGGQGHTLRDVLLFVGLHAEPEPVDLELFVVPPSGVRRARGSWTVTFDEGRVTGRVALPVSIVLGDWGRYRYEVVSAGAVLADVPFTVILR